MSMIKLENVAKYYKSTETVSVGMKKIHLEFNLGEFVAVTGESGSGKSTLLNVVSGLDGYEQGELYLFGEETSHYTIADWEKYRGANIGFVFQNYNIIDSYTVLQNVLLALEIQGYDPKTRKQRALELIERVGLTSHKNHKASKLSGGQKQRAVIARALAKDCPIIVADEPTGNLDSESSKSVMELLHEVSVNKLVVVVTHDYEQVAKYATRRIKMHDGEVIEDKKIKKAEIVTAIKVPEIKKMTFATLLRFAVRNLLATPKKLFFLLLLQILAIAVFTLVYTNQVQDIREAGLTQSQVFPNVPATRLLVERRDGQPFSIEELTYFGALRGVNYVYEDANMFYNQHHLSVMQNGHSIFSPIRGTDTANVLLARDVEGRLPVAYNEIVMSSGFFHNFIIGDQVEFTAGEFSNSFGDTDQGVSNSIGHFEIVGIDKRDRNIVYFSDAFLRDSSKLVELIDLNLYWRTSDAIGQSLSFTHDSASVFLERSFESLQHDVLVYGEGPITILTDQTITFSARTALGTIVSREMIGLSVAVPDSLSGRTSGVINRERYDELFEYLLEQAKNEYLISANNIISLSIDGHKSGNLLVQSIDSETYRVFYPANIHSPEREALVFFASLVAVVFLGVFGIFIYTIVHAVTRNVMNARKKDFAIYRSIGANKSSLARLVIIEQVIMSVVGFVITIIILQVLSNNFSFIGDAIKYMEHIDYAILLGVFMLLGAWLGLRFNKKVFRQSVIETITMSREE